VLVVVFVSPVVVASVAVVVDGDEDIDPCVDVAVVDVDKDVVVEKLAEVVVACTDAPVSTDVVVVMLPTPEVAVVSVAVKVVNTSVMVIVLEVTSVTVVDVAGVCVVLVPAGLETVSVVDGGGCRVAVELLVGARLVGVHVLVSFVVLETCTDSDIVSSDAVVVRVTVAGSASAEVVVPVRFWLVPSAGHVLLRVVVEALAVVVIVAAIVAVVAVLVNVVELKYPNAVVSVVVREVFVESSMDCQVAVVRAVVVAARLARADAFTWVDVADCVDVVVVVKLEV